MPSRPPESVQIVVGYADATYDFFWRPAEPGIHVRVAFDAANGDAGEAALVASRPPDVARLLDALRRLIVALPGPSLDPTLPPARPGASAQP
jgi:hypothetical protein